MSTKQNTAHSGDLHALVHKIIHWETDSRQQEGKWDASANFPQNKRKDILLVVHIRSRLKFQGEFQGCRIDIFQQEHSSTVRSLDDDTCQRFHFVCAEGKQVDTTVDASTRTMRRGKNSQIFFTETSDNQFQVEIREHPPNRLIF